MNLYLLVLFLHIIGAVLLFTGLGMEGIILKRLNMATTSEQLLSWGPSMKLLPAVFGSAAVLLLLSGIYMVAETWGWTAWVIIGLLLLIVLSGAGSMGGKKIAGVLKSLKGNEPLTTEIKEKLSLPFLIRSYKIRASVVLGIIFIMTIKTGWLESIAAIIIAFVVGLIFSFSNKEAKET
jgi:hypothetical protein